MAGVSFREPRLFLPQCCLWPLPTSHLHHHQQWGCCSFPITRDWAVSHSTKFKCDNDGHSEQIIAVSAEIISYETGMSQGMVPVLPCRMAWDGPTTVPVDASLSSRSVLYHLSQVNTKVRAGRTLTIAWHHCWQTRDHNGCSWKNPRERLSVNSRAHKESNREKHVAQTRYNCREICWALGTPAPLSHQV